MAKKHKVIFQPSGSRGMIEEGKTLREAAQELGVDLEAVCGGKGTCGKDKVTIQEGYFEKFDIDSRMENLSPLHDAEKKKLKPQELENNYRLACLTQVMGDVLVFVPEESRGGGQVVRKAATDIKIENNPAIRKYYVELPKPTLHDCEGDFERLTKALRKTHFLPEDLRMDYTALKALPDVLREADFKVTVTVWENELGQKEIIKVEPGLNTRRVGMAVDIGTTTVVGYLTDLSTGKVISVDSMMNPQVQYGEDVMARISYCMGNPDGQKKMHDAIIQGLNKIIKVATEEANLTPEDVLGMVVVGNTCMHHLFLDFNPIPVGKAPFPPTIHHSVYVKARDLGLKTAPGAWVHTLPIEAGFVGADNMGVVIALEDYKKDEIGLAIDIGTNGEITFGNKEKMYSTSCATGPAFEGAQIKFGMRAAPGAIERIRIDPETLECDFKVIGKTAWHGELETEIQARGICGSGIIEAIAEMFKAGIIKRNGNINMDLAERSPRIRKDEEGNAEYVIAWEKDTSIGKDITVTQADVRAMQLAKGALYTGAKILMKNYGVTECDRVILAGAFGSYIDKEASMVIGMFPDCDLEKVQAVGNAAGDGARIALVNKEKRKEADVVARQIEYIELTVDPDFQKEFMMAMHLPHMKDKFPHVQHILDKIPK
jgi:uncharacterized 2Fe-2S/4Fe-4S cluster protein (DUF4445 family)